MSQDSDRRPGDVIIKHTRSNPEDEARRSRRLRGVGLNSRTLPLDLDADHTALSRLLRYGGTVLALSVTSLLLWIVKEDIGLLNIGLIYLIVVVGATTLAGRKAGILASVLGFALFDFFLVPPYLTFAIGDLRNILALFVFLGVSALISSLISGAREQTRQAERRAHDVSRLYELSQTIIGARRLDEVLPAIAAKVVDVFEVQACWILLPNDQQQLVIRTQSPTEARALTRDETTLADWAFWHATGIGQGGLKANNGHERKPSGGRATELAQRNRSAFVPLRAAGRTIGVLAVTDKKNDRPFTAAERTVLATFADQAAVALERLSLLKEAQRAEMLARTDELKSALMSAVSHDLRTPLASIMASVTSLLEPGIEWDEETKRDFLQGIYDEALRLNRLVGNLLDMSRIEGGALHPEKNWYTIGEIIGAVTQRLEPRLADHPVTVDVAPNIPMTLLDFSEIDQVITNLVENALKYTPPGTPISIKARHVDEQIEVSVRDTGPGVPREHLPHLFDKFYRVDKGNRSMGTGLGLAITRGFIEAHGGRIWAQNALGGGLVVTFTLPVASPEARSKAHDATKVEAST